MKEFDSDYTDKVVCPYCGAAFDPCEFGEDYFTENESVEECYECGKEYQVQGKVEWSWTTRKKAQIPFKVKLEKPGMEPVEVVMLAKDANDAFTAAEQMSIGLLGGIYKIEIEAIKKLRPKETDA